MKNKPLLFGVVIAVVALVLASLSPVVGFHTVKSSVKDSPLFAVRTRRAIDAEQDSLTCNYIGKGKKIMIPIPARVNDTELVEKITNRIRMMDDESLDEFIELAIRHLYEYNKINNDNIHIGIGELNQLRTNPQAFKLLFNNEFGYDLTSKEEPTICKVPGCWLYILNYIIFLIYFAMGIFISQIFTCYTICNYEYCFP